VVGIEQGNERRNGIRQLTAYISEAKTPYIGENHNTAVIRAAMEKPSCRNT